MVESLDLCVGRDWILGKWGRDRYGVGASVVGAFMVSVKRIE